MKTAESTFRIDMQKALKRYYSSMLSARIKEALQTKKLSTRKKL